MGGCCVPYCTNSARKGYLMKIFPKDIKQRNIWIRNIPSTNWKFTTNSRICEVHFASEMWKPESNYKKLKKNAIPTLFGFDLEKLQRQNCIEADFVSDINNVNSVNTNVNINVNTEAANNDVSEADFVSDITDVINNVNSANTNVNINVNTEAANNDVSEADFVSKMTDAGSVKIAKTLKKYIDLVNKQHAKMIVMRKTIKSLRRRIQTLECSNDEDCKNCKYKQAVTALFKEDQVRALINKKRVKNWSNETIKRSLKLKFACGVTGYETLIEQGIPLPSIRTLTRKLEELKFEPGICQDMLEFLQYKKSAFSDERDLECGLTFDEMSITKSKLEKIK